MADRLDPQPASPPPPQPLRADPSEQRTHNLARNAVRSVVVAAVFGGTAWVASLLLQSSQSSVAASASTIALLMSVVVLLLAGTLAHEVIYWRLPTMRFKRMLEEAHSGAIEIEAIRAISRGPKMLVDPAIELLEENKILRTQLQELNLEMRQRIHNRTDALERKLGAAQAKAARDGLTGLSNRRSFDEELPRTVDSCRAERRDLALMMVDVDYFKTLNDTLGHKAGDDLLRSIGQIIRSTIRDTDSAYRYGGDEFVLLLPGGDKASAAALQERLRYLVDGLTKHVRNLSQRPQLSIGIAHLYDLGPGATPEQLLQAGDQKLYAIKHARPVKSRMSA